MKDGILYLLFFLPAVLAVYYLTPSRYRTARNIVLFAAGLLYCGFEKPAYMLILVFSTVFTYSMGRLISSSIAADDWPKARHTMTAAVFVHCILIAYFCYSGLWLKLAAAVSGGSGTAAEILLPAGAMVYTLQAISYLADVYSGRLEADYNYLHTALAMSFFPVLTAGPIVRFPEISGQIADRRESWNSFGSGVCLLAVGLGKAAVLSAAAGSLWTLIVSMDPLKMSAVTAWTGAIAVTFQIYFAFSGVSDMAAGIGRMFGFSLRRNFDYPLLSESITEFWHRWNKTLISWFRDYIYVPLGGEKDGAAGRIRALLISAVLVGLWHGSGLRLVVFGLYFAFLTVMEELIWGRALKRIHVRLRRLYTIFLVIIGWVIFACPGIRFGLAYISAMFGGCAGFADGTGGYYLRTNLFLFIILAVASTPLGMRFRDKYLMKKGTGGMIFLVVYYVFVFLVSIAFMAAGRDAVYSFFRY